MPKKTMDPIVLLKEDHKKVKALFKSLEATSNKAEKKRQDLFEQIFIELTTHAEIEEKLFYPELLPEKPIYDITLESYEEHHVVKLLLEELDAQPKCSDQWKAKAIVLREVVEHHVKEEEHDMFKKVRKNLTREELAVLGEEMYLKKQEMMKKRGL